MPTCVPSKRKWVTTFTLPKINTGQGTIASLLTQLKSLQISDEESVLYGNYTSSRYHTIFPLRREEDNVYFVSWINQLLKRNVHLTPEELHSDIQLIIQRGEKSIEQYRNRYGDKTYNFYRPEAWFPNGRFLSKHVKFQPTDDSDDTSIALRGKSHSIEYAQDIKAIYSHQSNGLRGRFIKRGPKKYRQLRFHNTWIGSEGLYVDLDIVVLCNILMFNSLYGLSKSEEDQSSLLLLVDSIETGDYLKEKWSIAAWYPFDAVILYCIADLISTGYYPNLNEWRSHIAKDIHGKYSECKGITEKLLMNLALLKLELDEIEDFTKTSLSKELSDDSKFSFGVIPLLHPYDGRFMQYVSQLSLFRMKYDCKAQRLAIGIEYMLLKGV